MNNRKPKGNYHWATKDIATIRAMAESGTGHAEIARVLGRPVERVRDVAAKNGTRSKRQRAWSTAQCELYSAQKRLSIQSSPAWSCI